MTENTAAQAAALRAEAADADRAAAESFERCDTDGFLSQWASGLTAQQKRLEARLVEAGGRWKFAALFDLDGNHVPAKHIFSAFGPVWMLLDENGQRKAWFNESNARKAKTRRTNNAKKGMYVGLVSFPATVVLGGGGGTGLSGATSVRPIVVPVSSDDLAMGRGVEVVANGQPGMEDDGQEDW